MAIQPPDNLLWWALLKYWTIDQLWPPDNEDDAYALAQQWTLGAQAVRGTIGQVTNVASAVPAGWPDEVGGQFATGIGSFGGAVEGLAAAMDELSGKAKAYGD